MGFELLNRPEYVGSLAFSYTVYIATLRILGV